MKTLTSILATIRRKNIIRSIVALSLVLNSLTVFSQTDRFDWIRTIGDSGDDAPEQIANDSSGNVYVTGAFVGQLIFGADTLHSFDYANAGIFLAKYDSNGNALWGKLLPMANPYIGGSFEITLNKLKISRSGKIFVVGGLNYSGTTYSYIACCRSNGNLVGYGETRGQMNSDVDADSLDNSYVSGYTMASTYNFFVAKYDSSGNDIWGYISINESKAHNIKYLNGNVYVAGQFKYRLNLADTVGSSPITLNASAGINDWDFFIAKYSANGHLLAGNRDDGLIPTVGGMFSFGSDFDINGNWTTFWASSLGTPIIKKFSPTLGVVYNNTSSTLHIACSFPATQYLRCSAFTDEGVLNVLGFCSLPSTDYHFNSSGNIVEGLVVPYAGGGPGTYIPYHGYSFNKNSTVFVMSGFQGTMSYLDQYGSTNSASSSFASQDIFIGKYHRGTTSTTGITMPSGEKSCSIYPNPVHDKLTVKGAQEAAVKIFNLLGQEIYTVDITDMKQMLDLKNIGLGTYLMQITFPDGRRNNVKLLKN
jgi:hypothetical protein